MHAPSENRSAQRSDQLPCCLECVILPGGHPWRRGAQHGIMQYLKGGQRWISTSDSSPTTNVFTSPIQFLYTDAYHVTVYVMRHDMLLTSAGPSFPLPMRVCTCGEITSTCMAQSNTIHLLLTLGHTI